MPLKYKILVAALVVNSALLGFLVYFRFSNF